MRWRTGRTAPIKSIRRTLRFELSRASYRGAPDSFQRVHDVRVVRPSSQSVRATVVHRGGPQLGHRAVRVHAAGAGQSHWLLAAVARPAQDHSGSDYTRRVRAVCLAVHAAAHELELSVGRLLPTRRGLFHVQVMHVELLAIQQEFESALVRLHELRNKVPAEMWRRRPAPERWSPGECVAHLNLSSAFMVPLVRAGIDEARRSGRTVPARYRRDVLGWLLWKGLGPGKGFKTKAIPAWVPSGDRHPDELVAEFERWQ